MRIVILGAALVGLAVPAHAETASIAVAANFTAVAERLAEQLTAQTGHELRLSFGATGQLFTQISQGAPFDVFLAADNTRPAQAVSEGLGVQGTEFTYAIGALALYSASLDLTDGAAVLEASNWDRLAIADPQTAPYGAAAVATLAALGLTDATAPKLVTGENITQTLQFVDSGNAELGFVAASQVIDKTNVWIVPADLYAPIEQDAVLLTHGQDNPAATAFIDFLQGPAATATIAANGYTVP